MRLATPRTPEQNRRVRLTNEELEAAFESIAVAITEHGEVTLEIGTVESLAIIHAWSEYQ